MGETRAMWFLVVWLFLASWAPWAVHVEGCSSRWFPCTRPSPATPPPPDLPLPAGQEQSVLTTTLRPPVVFETKECPEKFNDWYCLNGKCFMVYTEYYCECYDGYEGVRCEHKYVDAESVLASLRAADIRNFVVAVGPLLLVVVILAIFVWRLKKKKKLESAEGGGGGGGDEVDGPAPPPRRVPFGPRSCENPPMELMVPPRVPRAPVRRSTSVSLQGAQRANNL